MEYTLESLEVYQLAEVFSDKIWLVVTGWDYFLKRNIGSQMTRAADSISANIAEWYGRHFFGESRNFYFYARGSLPETKAWLSKCQRRKLITESQYDELMNEADAILAKLINYIKFIEKQQLKLKK
jgi:four helix bundle protein